MLVQSQYSLTAHSIRSPRTPDRFFSKESYTTNFRTSKSPTSNNQCSSTHSNNGMKTYTMTYKRFNYFTISTIQSDVCIWYEHIHWIHVPSLLSQTSQPTLLQLSQHGSVVPGKEQIRSLCERGRRIWHARTELKWSWLPYHGVEWTQTSDNMWGIITAVHRGVCNTFVLQTDPHKTALVCPQPPLQAPH